MSDILIKGMEMPVPGAYTCELGVLDNNTAVLTIYTPIDEPQKSYTLVPIPPHGRLIDADALDTEILQAGFSYALTRRKLRYTPGDVRQKIANAPTIIPAEESEI